MPQPLDCKFFAKSFGFEADLFCQPSVFGGHNEVLGGDLNRSGCDGARCSTLDVASRRSGGEWAKTLRGDERVDAADGWRNGWQESESNQCDVKRNV
jgi:hypothetical protein